MRSIESREYKKTATKKPYFKLKRLKQAFVYLSYALLCFVILLLAYRLFREVERIRAIKAETDLKACKKLYGEEYNLNYINYEAVCSDGLRHYSLPDYY
jgi:hypothetical protein